MVLPAQEHSSLSLLAIMEMMWRSWALKTWSLLLINALNCVIIAVVGILLGLSLKNDGFVDLGEQQDSAAGSGQPDIWQRGLLWTTLPSLLFTFYRFYFDSVVTSLVNEAPFAELYSTTGSPIKKSLLLDYRTYPSLYSWAVAFRNRRTAVHARRLVQQHLTQASRFRVRRVALLWRSDHRRHDHRSDSALP